jgi:hemoglobin/transferrin/lactoferrin receptor protein
MKFIKHAIVGLLIFNFQLSFAQTTDPDTSQSKSINLEEVVISVNQVEETKKTVAQQIQVMKANEIDATQSQSTADVIANTGSVFVQKSQMGGGSPVIRGFEASRILLVVDGVRLNNLIYRAGHLQDITKTDNNNMDRVEVLFGPSSTVYGSDALGGVIHLYTKKPLFAMDDTLNIKANAKYRYGSVADESTGHVDFNIGGKTLASLTSFTYSNFGDLKGGENQNPFYTTSYGERPYYVQRFGNTDSLVKNSDRYVQVHSGYSQYDLLQKISFRPKERTTHGLNFQYSNSTDVPRYDRLTDPGGIGLRFGEWYYGPQKRMMIAYDMNIVNNEGAAFQRIHLGVNYQDIEESRHDRRSSGATKDLLNHRIENVDVIGANIDFQKIINAHNIRFGADVQMNNLESTANQENIVTGEIGKLDTRYPDGDNNMTNIAAYITHTWKLNDRVTLTDGIRGGYSTMHSTLVDTSFVHLPYNVVEQNTPVWSGSLGIINTPSDDTKLSFLVATGFRVPNVDDMSKIFESQAGAVVVPNVDLKPERTVNYEASITNVFNEKSRWENVVYYTDFFDAIVMDEFKFNGQDSIIYDGSLSQVYANQNKRRAYLYGFSSSYKSQCSEHLLFSMSINYTYGRIKTDSSDYPLDHIPPFFSRMLLSYHYGKFSSDFFINFNGWKRLKDYNIVGGEDNEQYATVDGMPAWFTANVHASYKVHKLITLQAGVDNIFDTQYRAFASGINAPGRNVFAALRFHY